MLNLVEDEKKKGSFEVKGSTTGMPPAGLMHVQNSPEQGDPSAIALPVLL